jgi:predicted protein tyrosine phosphatase
MTKILFICSANVDRSPTAAHIYAKREGFEAKSAGVSWSARKRVTAELIQWADIILCMEEWQKQFIEKEFSDVISHQKTGYLDITDDYLYMQPMLIDVIKEKTEAWLIRHQN